MNGTQMNADDADRTGPAAIAGEAQRRRQEPPILNSRSSITVEIEPYSPARRAGWISRHGHPLRSPDRDDVLTCPESRLRRREPAPAVLGCLDLDEDASLPEDLRPGPGDLRLRRGRPPLETARAQDDYR